MQSFTSTDIKYGSSKASLCKKLKRRRIEVTIAVMWHTTISASRKLNRLWISWDFLPIYHYLILRYLSLEVILLGEVLMESAWFRVECQKVDWEIKKYVKRSSWKLVKAYSQLVLLIQFLMLLKINAYGIGSYLEG